MASKEADKGTRYVALLYEARCDNRWQDVPELARKVDKHTSGRRCFTLAARADAVVQLRPGREGCTSADEEFGEVLSAALRESQYSGDVLDASVAHAAIFYGRQQPELALTQVPEPLHRTRLPSSGSGAEAWLAVCVIRGTLIRGLSFEAQDNQDGAGTTYRSVISYLSKVINLEKPCPALRQAAEELITHICLYFATSTDKKPASIGEAMAAFHVLSQLLSRQSGKFISSRGIFTRNTPRQFWRVYYTALSEIVKRGFVYHPSPLDRDHEAIEHKGLLDDDEFLAARKHQRAELRRVEQSYEAILLQETKFPKANETNDEINDWIELAMGNWRVLCGSAWTADELGEGGKSSVGRNVLDILYRAQTKTFHSTQILRHLVTVHAYLAEFDLAFKAFDSYVEILTKGKARANKTGSAGFDLDDDDTAMSLAAEVIRLACRFGSNRIAEKAYGIGLMVKRWLEHGSPDTPILAHPPSTTKANLNHEPIRTVTYSKPVIGIAYRSIAVSQATWARHCYDPATRKVLRENAVANLRTALRLAEDASTDLTDTLFALGTIQAELGHIDEAIKTVDICLGVPGSSESASADRAVARSAAPEHGEAKVDEIGLLPLRHLKALLMSAAEDYEASAATCEAALDKVSAFGSSPKIRDRVDGSFTVVAKSMENHDKQNALELKMTQITLAGIAGGPQRAVNASNELIALYSQLFGLVAQHTAPLLQSDPVTFRPKSSSGTIRSMFSRRTSRRTTQPNENQSSALTSSLPSAVPSGATSALPSRPQTMATAPAIHVISEKDEKQSEDTDAQVLESVQDGQVEADKDLVSNRGAKNLGSLKKKTPSRPNTSEGNAAISTEKPDGSGVQAGGAQPMEDIPHNLPHDKTDLPTGHEHQPPRQDTRLPVPPPRSDRHAPPPQFLLLQERRFKTSLLIKVWLFIANLYSAYDQFSEADEAIVEARSLIEHLESELSQEEASVKHMQEPGWAGGKSVEELWADVSAERGNLLGAQSRPHDALLSFEKALTHAPNHCVAIVGLSNILLDMYEQNIPSEKPDSAASSITSAVFSSASIAVPPQTANGHAGARPAPPPIDAAEVVPATNNSDTLALYRIAARDRAYGLMSSITSLPEGASDPQAWLTLARTFELSSQIHEARKALWKVVELEDARPVRQWSDIGPGGYVLW